MNAIKENKYEIFLLGIAILSVVFSFKASIVSPKGNWFSRSGAIVVLLSVMVDYHIGSLQQKKISGASLIAGFGLPASSDLPKAKQYISKCALVLAVIGTLIWGYGDLIV